MAEESISSFHDMRTAAEVSPRHENALQAVVTERKQEEEGALRQAYFALHVHGFVARLSPQSFSLWGRVEPLCDDSTRQGPIQSIEY